MLSSISVPESGLLETVRLHSTSLVLSPVACKPRCPLRSLSVRNVGRARASTGAEDNGRRQLSAQGRTQELVSKITVPSSPSGADCSIMRRRSFSGKPGTPSGDRCGVSNRSGNRQFNFSTGFEIAPQFEISTNGFGSFAHPSQAPVTRAGGAIEHLRFHSFPIVTDSQAQLALIVVDL